MIPDGYRLERGMLWPAEDLGAAAALFTLGDLETVYQHCRGFDVAVQAGGCCGVWPAEMAKRFALVYTFEPDPMNFRCLCANAPAENVIKFNAALGAEHRSVGLLRRPENVGAHKVEGLGSIPTLRIDDLCLAACDLIHLDVEGSEIDALTGAAETIERCRPTIVVEDKGVSGAAGDVERHAIERFGYRVASRIHRDVILVP